jgi:hypothetical protein
MTRKLGSKATAEDKKNKEHKRRTQERTNENIYKANILLVCIVCSGSIWRPSMER